MQIIRVPDFLVAVTTLLTHGVGFSTVKMTPNSSSRVSSVLNFSFSAVGILWVGVTSGLTDSSTSVCTTPEKQPSCRSDTSECCVTTWSRVNRLFTFGLLLLGGAAGLKLSQFTVINFVCCAALALIKGSNSSLTTTNSTEYLLRLAGFVTIILAVPSGVTSVLFHMMRVFEVGVNLCLSTMLLGMIFIKEPQSIWNMTDLSSITISEKISFAKWRLSDGPTEHTFSAILGMWSTSSSSSAGLSVGSILCTFLPLFLHLFAKWFLPPHLLQLCPQARHWPRTKGWFPPQKLQDFRDLPFFPFFPFRLL